MLQKTIKAHITQFWTTDTQVRIENSKVAVPSLFPDTSYVYLASLLESTKSPSHTCTSTHGTSARRDSGLCWACRRPASATLPGWDLQGPCLLRMSHMVEELLSVPQDVPGDVPLSSQAHYSPTKYPWQPVSSRQWPENLAASKCFA